MFDEVPELLAGFKHLRHSRHEVILWHILDGAEMNFPFQESTLFRGLEQYPELLTDPRSLRASYLEQFGKFVQELEIGLPGAKHRLRADADRHAAERGDVGDL